MQEREPKRHEIKHVPTLLRSRDRQVGGEPVLSHYERICFDKDQMSIMVKPLAAFVCPGHPLLDSTIDLMLERHGDLLKRGAILVDPNDDSEEPRALFYLAHSVQDGRTDRQGNRRTVSRQLEFVEIDGQGNAKTAGYAPYLDYRPIAEDERKQVERVLESSWLKKDLEPQVISHAAAHIVPQHLEEAKCRKEELVTKTMAAVKDRLTKEINYWDRRANELKTQELAGKPNARINSGKARQRADELGVRLQRRLHELEMERQVSPAPPVVIGGCLVVPSGLLARLNGKRQQEPAMFARETARIERLAMRKVMELERNLGREPRDVSKDKLGYDIECLVPGNGKLLFIEVKGRVRDADTVTVSKNEILTGINKPEEFILAVVLVDGDQAADAVYVRKPFSREPDFGVTSVNYDLRELWARGSPPQ